MTPMQSRCLAIIKHFNHEQFRDEFLPSEIMAFIDVESSFRPSARHDDRPGRYSVGLMQVENTTAQTYGVVNMDDLKSPDVAIRVGMGVANDNWNALQRHFGREPSYEEWAAAYNEGIGNVLKGRADDAYVDKWLRAQERWASVGVDA